MIFIREASARIERHRFWAKVDRAGDDECWNWVAGTNKDGYGVIWLNGTLVRAHRWSMTLYYPSWDQSLIVDHRCNNRRCVNPRHLRATSTSGNNRLKGWCRAKLHRMTPENTITKTSGHRQCRACHREANRRYRTRGEPE